MRIIFVAVLLLRFSLFAAEPLSTDALQRYYEVRFSEQEKWMRESLSAVEKRSEMALAAADKAVTKAEVAAEKRFESLNEFRGQLKDQQGTFVTRSEAWGYLVGLFGILMAVLNFTRRPAAVRAASGK